MPRILMSLDARYYELIVSGQKTFEYRKRFPDLPACDWYVYLTAPAATLVAVVRLGTPIVAAPAEIAEIAEKARPGNGASVHAYLRGRATGVALPIHRVREYSPGLPAAELSILLGRWHPPQGYAYIDTDPVLAAACDRLLDHTLTRDLLVSGPLPPR